MTVYFTTFTRCSKCGKRILAVHNWIDALCKSPICRDLHEQQLKQEEITTNTWAEWTRIKHEMAKKSKARVKQELKELGIEKKNDYQRAEPLILNGKRFCVGCGYFRMVPCAYDLAVLNDNSPHHRIRRGSPANGLGRFQGLANEPYVFFCGLHKYLPGFLRWRCSYKKLYLAAGLNTLVFRWVMAQYNSF